MSSALTKEFAGLAGEAETVTGRHCGGGVPGFSTGLISVSGKVVSLQSVANASESMVGRSSESDCGCSEAARPGARHSRVSSMLGVL